MSKSAAIISERLRAFLGKDEDNRQKLVRAGLKNGHIDQILDATIVQQVLFVVAQKLVDIAAIDIREIYFASVLETFVQDGALPDALSGIASFELLSKVFAELLAAMSNKRAAAYFGVFDKRVAGKWVKGWPNEPRIEQMLRFVRESREGTLFVPVRAKASKPPSLSPLVKKDDWRKRFRDLHKDDPKRYCQLELSRRLAIGVSTVKHWFEKSDPTEPKPEQMAALRREFPELFSGSAGARDPAKPAKEPASNADQQMVLSSLISMFNSGLTVIKTTVAPREVVDGDRSRIIDLVSGLFEATGINPAAFVRLARVEKFDPSDPMFRVLFKHQQRPQRR